MLLKFPPELRQLIYDKCGTQDLSILSCCSSFLYEEVKPVLWKTVTLSWDVLSNEDFALQHNLRKLQNLKYTTYLVIKYFTRNRPWPRGFIFPKIPTNYKELIRHCNPSLLEGIHMMEYHCDSDGECARITCDRFPNLKRVYIRDADIIPSQVCFSITELEHLSVLDLNFTHTTDEMLLAICKKLVNLTFLDVTCSQNLTDEGFREISNLRLLKRLEMGHNCFISSALSYLDGLTQLEYFDCPQTLCTHFPSLKKLTSLEHLNLRNTRLEDVDFVDADIALKNINTLIVVNNALTDEGIRYIGKMVSLVKLDISVTFLSDEGIPYLIQLSFLKELNIGDTFISDAGLTWIKRMKLRSLDVANTKISDKGLEHISEMGSLTYFGCWDTQITDVGVRSIGKLTGLEHLSINAAGDVLTCNGLLEGIVPLECLKKINVLRCYRRTEEFKEFCQRRNIVCR